MLELIVGLVHVAADAGYMPNANRRPSSQSFGRQSLETRSVCAASASTRRTCGVVLGRFGASFTPSALLGTHRAPHYRPQQPAVYAGEGWCALGPQQIS